MRVNCEMRIRTGAIDLVSEIDAIVEVIASHGRFDAARQIASKLVRPATERIVACVVERRSCAHNNITRGNKPVRSSHVRAYHCAPTAPLFAPSNADALVACMMDICTIISSDFSAMYNIAVIYRYTVYIMCYTYL